LINCAPYSLPEKYTPADETALAYYQDSHDDYSQGRYEEAQVKINQAIQLNPNFAQFYQLKGDIARALLKYDDALDAYKEAIRARSNFPAVYQSMGEIYYIKGQFEEAVKSYKKILATDEKRVDVYLETASCYIQMQELSIAFNNIQDYLRLTESFGMPTSDSYLYLRGKIYFAQKKYAEAIADLSLYDKNHTRDKNSLSLLGRSHYALEEYEKGLSYYNRLVQLEPERGEWYLQRGIYFIQKEDFNDALSQFERALTLDNLLFEVYYYLGRVHEEQGNPDQALEAYERYQENAGEKCMFPDITDRIRNLHNRKNM